MTNISLKSNPIFWIYAVSISLFIAMPAWFLFQRNSAAKNSSTNDMQPKSYVSNKAFTPTHRVTIAGKNGQINVRRRALSTQEYTLLQKPEQKKLIDAETWMGVLMNGDAVQLLHREGWSYKIRYESSKDKQIITGYIAISDEKGKPSVQSLP
jgi:hypothetical protein